MSKLKDFIKKHHTLFDILKYICVGLLITALLIVMQIYIEHTYAGHKLELLACELLQGQLSSISDDDPPVLVLDIDKMPGGHAGEVTPRETLKELIEAIADQSPKAIALDIDFSPDRKGFKSEDDPDFFFDYCLTRKKVKNVPVFLGVHRTIAEDPATWLGMEDYKELAVALLANKKDSTRLPVWVEPKDKSYRLPTLSSALAQAYRGQPLPEPPAWMRWATETTTEVKTEAQQAQSAELVLTNALVNYSKLRVIELSTRSILSPTSVRESGKLFNGKMVIIGNTEEATDKYNVPGRDDTIPGIYLHACSAYTLVQEPLYEMNHWVRLLLDFLISAVIILSVAWFRFRHTQEADNDAWHQRQSRFIWLAVICVPIAGILLIRLLGVMWLDFILVIFALLLHPWAEKRFDDLLGKEEVKGEGEASPSK